MAKRNVSICFTGPASSGKTAMISALFSDTAGVVVDTSCPTVGFRQYLVPFENPNVLAQVIDLGSQGDNLACLSNFLTCK